jgi:dTDP-4-amino-4,6-dideoxygalactose transaminase
MLEERLATYLGFSRECVTTLSNATQAIQGAMVVSGLHKWTIPAWTFAATAQAALSAGKQIDFEDVKSDWRLDAEVLAKNQCTIEVAPFGDDLKISNFLKVKELLIVDAAASIDALFKCGEKYKSEQVGFVISLHATKLMSAGEGGIFVSHNSDWVAEIRQWSNFGFTGASRECAKVGTNAKMSEYNAAVALASLDRWNENREEFLRLIDWANHLSTSVGFKTHPAMEKGFVSPYWIINGSETQIQQLRESLELNRISHRMWWGKGLHRMPLFQDMARGEFRNTDKLANTTIGIPMHRNLTEENKERIEKAIVSA